MDETRPDWRDPNMPVLMQVRQEDGTTKLEEFPPESVQEWAQFMVERETDPCWREDPTYNLRRKK